jgi:hypothetical protein
MTYASALLLLLLPSLGGLAGCNQSCDTAQTQFDNILRNNLSCSVDDDCTTISSSCVAPCGTFASKAGASTVQNAATSLCKQYNCPEQAISCPASDPLVCAKGTCATYSVYAETYAATVKQGVCIALQLDFAINGTAADAPHDMAVPVSVNGGTVYADTACKTPVISDATPAENATMSVPAGAKSIVFGFSATAPGPCSIDVGSGGFGSADYSFTAE